MRKWMLLTGESLLYIHVLHLVQLPVGIVRSLCGYSLEDK